jgi:hypothetical protein
MAAEQETVLGYYVDDRTQPSAGACELTVLKSYDQQSVDPNCEVATYHVSDCLIRCGEQRRYTSTTYDVNEGITAVMVVYTTPALLSDEVEVALGKFDAEYERRGLYAAGRHELREYWLSLSPDARRHVKRAYALLVAPTGVGVYQVETWFE